MTDTRDTDYHAATIAAQAGGYIDDATGGVTPPIQPSTTYARHPDYSPMSTGYLYGRDDSSVVRIAENVLARLEGAAETLLFPSGMAAIAALVRTTRNGGTIVLQSQIYWGATKWVREFCARREITLHEADASKTSEFCELVQRGKPDLVMVETPSNPWLRTTDLTAVAKACKSAGALLAVDSTAATPIHSQPLAFGADIVVHAATKAINGHSDVLAGVLAVANAELPAWRAIRTDRHDAGAILGAFEAWLLLRGMRTLPLRVERMSANALAVARAMENHPAIEKVFYPGLQSDPGHEIARRQMQGGFGSLLSVLVKGGAPEALTVCGKLKLFKRATSLGGVESLVEHRHTIEGDATGVPRNLVRLSVGIEDERDLVADLDSSLEGIG